MDQATRSKDKLAFARIMVEVGIQHVLPEDISFLNDHGVVMEQRVEYEWKLVQCEKCLGYGHEAEACRKNTRRKIWVQKKKITKDEEGFSMVGNQSLVQN